MSIIFYSWQSDRPNRGNRSLIAQAIEGAIEALRYTDTIEQAVRESMRLDQDTRGVAGSPDITQTIFKKIVDASACVFDVSFVNDEPPTKSRDAGVSAETAVAFRRTPNPNVLIELGYAMGIHPMERIIMVCNTAFGPVEELPFDIRHRRVLSYRLAPTEGSAADARAHLLRQVRTQLALVHEFNAQPRYSKREMEFWTDLFETAHYIIDAAAASRYRLVPDGLDEFRSNCAHCSSRLRQLCSHEIAQSSAPLQAQMLACASELDKLSRHKISMGGMNEVDVAVAALVPLLRELLGPCTPVLAHKLDKTELKLLEASLVRQALTECGRFRIAVAQGDADTALAIRESLPATGWKLIELCQRLDVIADADSAAIRPLAYAMHRATHRASSEAGIGPERVLLGQVEALLAPMEALVRGSAPTP